MWLLDPRGWLALVRFWLSVRRGEHDRKLTAGWPAILKLIERVSREREALREAA